MAALVLVVGIAATVVLTSVTMAVRTGSAFDRMVEANEIGRRRGQPVRR